MRINFHGTWSIYSNVANTKKPVVGVQSNTAVNTWRKMSPVLSLAKARICLHGQGTILSCTVIMLTEINLPH